MMKSAALALYRLCGRIIEPVVSLAGLFTGLVCPGRGKEARQRLGWLPIRKDNDHPLIWVHGASVGEVKAAAILIKGLLRKSEQLDILLTTVTVQGQKIARDIMPAGIEISFAPLDLPGCAARAAGRVKPSLYICLETELWPNLLQSIAKNGCPAILLNARMSERSARGYRKFAGLARLVLKNFATIGTISEQDRQRFIDLGANKKTTTTCGNIKYDQGHEPTSAGEGEEYRARLHIRPDDRVLIAGSTHTDEEAMLLDRYPAMGKDIPGLLLIIAPRHLERVAEVERELSKRRIDFARLSELPDKRRGVILVDTMGDLAGLYRVAHWVFCGGSLVERGGHNIMEAAVHGVPIFYGPNMKDFADAAAILEACGGARPIGSVEDLHRELVRMAPESKAYREMAKAAQNAATNQRGAAERMTAIALQHLKPPQAAEKKDLNP